MMTMNVREIVCKSNKVGKQEEDEELKRQIVHELI